MATPATTSAFDARDLLSVFNALPGAFLLLSPALLIEAATDEYLAVALTTREQLVGQFIFDAFPDNPAAPEAHGLRNLRASLAQVLATGQLHQMAPQHYDVPDPVHPSQFVERHWLCTNRPVHDADGRIVYLLHTAVDITDQRRDEGILRESQAAEQAARAETEAQRQRFYEVLMQLPAYVAVYHGPEHVYQFVNPPYQSLFPHRSFAGRPFREGIPESEALGVVALFDRVYQTGEPFYIREMEGAFDFKGTGEPEQVFLNLSLHPLRNVQGRIDGILDYSSDVTEQVQARRQLEQLNHELEARVQERTREAEAARADAERQRARLESVFRQAPAAIAVYGGPDFVFELVNPVYQALLPGRPLLGKPVRDAFPEMAELSVFDTLRQVYETGITHHEQEQLIRIVGPSGIPENRYFNFTLQARYDEQQRVDGVVGFGFEVTEQVEARREADTLQAEVLAAAQRQAHEREAFHAVFEQTPALIALLRQPGHRYEYVNPAYQAAFPGRQLLGLDVAVAVPEMEQQGFVALLDHVYQSGETYFGREMPFAVAQPGDPAPRLAYFNFTMQAYREAGAISGVSIFAFDATEQVLARQERDVRQQELQRIFEQAPVAVFVLHGPELVVTIVNPVMQELLGPPLAELLGRPYFEAMPELATQGYADFLDQVWRTGQPFTAQEQPARLKRHRPGETGYFTFVFQPLHDAQGRLTDIMCVATDVTNQVLARHAAEGNARQLRLLTDALPVLIGYLDRERRYRFANEAYRAWFHQDPAALLGRKVQEVVGEKAYAVAAGYMDRALAGERLDFEATMPYREGFARHIRTSFIPDVQHGVVQGFYTLVSDITEQVEARQQVERLNQELLGTNETLHHTNTQLLRTNADLDTFVYAASHDLKAPIANIEGLLDALRDYLPAAEQEPMVPRLVGMMEGAITRFQQTVGHLTDVARLQSEATPPLESIDLAAVLADVRLDLLPLLESTRAELVLELTECPRIAFSTKYLRSVLFNLLSNAVKYRAPDRPPLVHVRTQCAATHLVLEVQDNGLGLSAAQQAQLFTMFRRLHTHVEGSGVGLYLIKRTLENAGGTIAVHSQPGVGSTFTVTIPRA